MCLTPDRVDVSCFQQCADRAIRGSAGKDFEVTSLAFPGYLSRRGQETQRSLHIRETSSFLHCGRTLEPLQGRGSRHKKQRQSRQTCEASGSSRTKAGMFENGFPFEKNEIVGRKFRNRPDVTCLYVTTCVLLIACLFSMRGGCLTLAAPRGHGIVSTQVPRHVLQCVPSYVRQIRNYTPITALLSRHHRRVIFASFSPEPVHPWNQQSSSQFSQQSDWWRPIGRPSPFKRLPTTKAGQTIL